MELFYMVYDAPILREEYHFPLLALRPFEIISEAEDHNNDIDMLD